jgi:intergrase/recombinase
MPGDSRVTHHYVLEDSAAEEDVKVINNEVMNDKLMILNF